jgi:hypothetical protein
VHALIKYVLNGAFHHTLCFKPMHAALLVPGRLASWLEGTSKLAVPMGQALFEAVEMLVTPQPPELPGMPAVDPGRGSAQQWKEGAALLQREVSHCLLLGLYL